MKFVIEGKKKAETVVGLSLTDDGDGVVGIRAKNNLGQIKCLAQFDKGKLHIFSYADMQGIKTTSTTFRIQIVSE